MSRSGADLALLLLGGFRTLVDGAMVELAARGYDDFRPTHEFAMRAIIAGADSASDVGRRLSVSKQAAAKTIAVLVARGYVSSDPDPSDARRNRLRVTARGLDLLREGEAVFEDLRARWEAKLGAAELAHLEASLRTLVGGSAVDPEAPGWVGRDAVGIEQQSVDLVTGALAWRFAPPGEPVVRGIDVNAVRDGRIGELRSMLTGED